MIRALALAAMMLASQARDNGQWQSADPSIRDWVRGLKDRQGISCCDDADGEEVEGWTFGAKGYMVKVLGPVAPGPAQRPTRYSQQARLCASVAALRARQADRAMLHRWSGRMNLLAGGMEGIASYRSDSRSVDNLSIYRSWHPPGG